LLQVRELPHRNAGELKIQDWQLSPHLIDVFRREQRSALFNVFGDRLYAALSRAASP
jgi:hypothetical protein